uniref:Nascent polypeptide-associated complex subunit alpha-like UBA domain-containing protein n=1 Tax=viral metagenome TaxID=1070528 RepID=A0A6C0J9E6_9ZZZZ
MTSITDEDVDILMKQCSITKEKAREILIFNEGNIVESIIMINTDKIDLNNLQNDKKVVVEEETDDFLVDSSKQENIKKYRDIVDSKDIVYNQKQKEKEEKELLKSNGQDIQKPTLSIEELYYLERGKSSFNSIRVL